MNDNEKEDISKPKLTLETPENARRADEDAPQERYKAEVAAKDEDDAGQTLKEAIREQAIEGENPQSKNFTIQKILGGDILSSSTIRNQIMLLILITAFIIAYISTRYSYQQKLIKLDQLTKELQDAKYKALSSSSELTEKSRESNVLEILKNNKDTTLKIASQPPYIINVPEE